MIAWISPVGTVQGQAVEDRLVGDSRVEVFNLEHLADTSFQADPQQLLRFDRELHRQLLQHLAGEAVDDQRDRASCVEPALIA